MATNIIAEPNELIRVANATKLRLDTFTKHIEWAESNEYRVFRLQISKILEVLEIIKVTKPQTNQETNPYWAKE